MKKNLRAKSQRNKESKPEEWKLLIPPVIGICLVITLIVPKFPIHLLQLIVCVLGWWIPFVYLMKLFPKFMEGIGALIWTFVGIGWSLWLVQLVEIIFQVQD